MKPEDGMDNDKVIKTTEGTILNACAHAVAEAIKQLLQNKWLFNPGIEVTGFQIENLHVKLEFQILDKETEKFVQDQQGVIKIEKH